MTAVACTRPGCARTTTDPSTRCHDHRLASRSDVLLGAPPALPPLLPSIPVSDDEGGVWEDFGSGSGRALAFRDEQGRLHRTDGPAYTAFRGDGSKSTETWSFEGFEHRVGGPAVTWFHKDHEVPKKEIYRLRGKTSRLDGPATVHYDTEGVIDELYYLANVAVEPPWFPGMTREDESARMPAAFAEVARKVDPADLDVAIEGTAAFGSFVAEGFDPEQVRAAYRTGIEAEILTEEGIRAIVEGAPVEWVRAYEESRS